MTDVNKTSDVNDAIVVEKLSKTIRTGFLGRKKQLLDGVSLTVPRGKTVGFIGSNGAGKSTTIKHLIGSSRPTSGSVRVMGENPAHAKARARLGYMPEIPQLPPTLTPNELIDLHGVLCGIDAATRAQRGKALLARLDLSAHAKSRVGGFSKGMQTRLSLLLALLHEPELFILDEPMSGLDPAGRQLVRTILHELSTQGRSIFFSSHVLSDVEALCDGVVIIRGGRIVYAGATSDVVGAAPNQWRLRVLTSDGREPSTAALPKESGARVRKEGDTFLIDVDGPDGVAIAAALQQSGVRVLSVEARRPSLEERTATMIGGAA
jgi:ABC-2 type transport system ATP-binding protein